jgi:hypothetical protein
MGFFGGNDSNQTKCKKCDLEFSSHERLERHTDKAHPKSSKTQLKKDTWGVTKTRNRKNRNVGAGWFYLFFFSQSHSGRSSSSSIIIGFKQILIFVSGNKFHYSRLSNSYSFGSLLPSYFPLSWHTQKQLSCLRPWFVLSLHSLVCVGSSGSKKSGNILQ